MAIEILYECQICCPSLARAKRIVPPEFVPAFDWFQENEGEFIDHLPHRMKPQETADGLPLSRDAGIYSPSKDRVEYKRKRYALSVHSTGSGRYGDGQRIMLNDEHHTWIVDYAAQKPEGSPNRAQDYNKWLMNCLEDGIPVGVMMKEGSGYRVLGLAFVECYNSASDTFTLHGPVNEESDEKETFNAPGIDGLTAEEKKGLEGLDYLDERKRCLVEKVRREQQNKFREDLIRAYGGRCAITSTSVLGVLQAAHIDPYRGKKSQKVSNGLLLRADMHLLFDAHLISAVPIAVKTEDFTLATKLKLKLSENLRGTIYEPLNKEWLFTPEDDDEWPDLALLGAHFEQFKQENKALD